MNAFIACFIRATVNLLYFHNFTCFLPSTYNYTTISHSLSTYMYTEIV